ncbi:Enamine deaminase RidA, house cleaning of reactive enamine intermediates, YjgF/YER057c/UK114 family [Atopomonas hussainii]|uniref:Enamine deaminase RidA, house cleaning of reactive enamine intermediates, YjgF/YER057c/UK114 family n=1 Tax=Atopomonas hussainii TaxID=1429083 RepID=A0A1H7EZX1_9GAMM|nr:RidA family protein [Atopomonas hussainii]SEK19456.1 Enamine deaminase RidA, house cleaning of reactive enamine intermediates, YjgF/YER057c/UK114 family [Atopomonas hussainii]
MSVQRLRTEKRFSEIVIHNGTVYLAGQLAENLDGDIVAQSQETLASVDQFLAEAGTDKSKVLSVTIYVKDMDAHYAGMNQVYDAWVAEGCAPARACVAAAMYDPRVLVEMTVIAAL